MRFKTIFQNVIAAATPSTRRQRRSSDFQLLDAFDPQHNSDVSSGRNSRYPESRLRGSESQVQQAGFHRNHHRSYQPPIELQSLREEGESEAAMGVGTGENRESQDVVPGEPLQVYNETSERLPRNAADLEASTQLSFSDLRLAIQEIVGQEEMPVARSSSEEDVSGSNLRQSRRPLICCCLTQRWKLRITIISGILIVIGCIFLTLFLMSLRGMNGIIPHQHGHDHEEMHEDYNLRVLRNQQWPLHDVRSRELNTSFDTVARAHKIWNFDKDDDDTDKKKDHSQEKKDQKELRPSHNETAIQQPTINGITIKPDILSDSYKVAREVIKEKLNEKSSKLNTLLWRGLSSAVAIEEMMQRSSKDNSGLSNTQNISVSGLLPVDLCYKKNESTNDFHDLTCNRSQRFRSIDGKCNNVIHAEWGSQLSAFRTIISSDIVSSLKWKRQSISTTENLDQTESVSPSPETISNVAHGGDVQLDTKTSALFPFWGMFILHDTVKVADSPVSCCEYAEHLFESNLAYRIHDIDVLCAKQSVQMYARKPSQYDPKNQSVLVEDTCSYFPHPAMFPSCEIDKPRISFNLVTSLIDASNVYGSSQETLDKLRLKSEGKLLVKSAKHLPEIQLPFLPSAKDHNESCFYGIPVNAEVRNCFLSGDTDVNEMAVLTSLNTILMRQHNWIAKFLHHHNPHWGDERIFKETRHILIAQIQHITYNEFLPEVLGKELMKIGGLALQDNDFYELYDSLVDPSVSDAFAGAVGYFWLSMVNGRAKSVWGKAKTTTEAEYDVERLYYRPNYINLHQGNLESLVTGFGSLSSNQIGAEISSQIRSLHIHVANKTLDLVKMVIQKGRDLNLAPYIEWRKTCGFVDIEYLSELKEIWNPIAFENAKKAFSHVSHIDLFTGMLAEKPIEGARVGPTLACLLIDQFLRFKKGDRFWYEGDVYSHHFSAEQLQEIRKTTLARIICDNTNSDLLEIQRWPLLISTRDSGFNPIVLCRDSRIPRLNFRLWKEKIKKKVSEQSESKDSAEDENEWYSIETESNEDQEESESVSLKSMRNMSDRKE